MMQFLWPFAFLFLPLPALVYFLGRRYQPVQNKLFAPSLIILADGQQETLTLLPWPKRILLLLAWLALVCALARPTYIGEVEVTASTGRNMLIAVDLSKSMEREDMRLNDRAADRLMAVKAVVDDFIKQRSGDRMGLILFGTNAYVQVPLTYDLQSLQQLLQESFIGMAGDRTAIGDAIGLSVKRLQELPESNRVMILLTDGANTAGDVTPQQAAELAAQAGVKIYTVGMGADSMELQDIFGTRTVNPSQDLDEDSLRSIAETTLGQYFRARSTDDLQRIYQMLDQIEEIKIEHNKYRPQIAYFYFPLAICFIALSLLAGLLLMQRKSQ